MPNQTVCFWLKFGQFASEASNLKITQNNASHSVLGEIKMFKKSKEKVIFYFKNVLA